MHAASNSIDSETVSQSSGDFLSADVAVCRVTLIGPVARREFRELVNWLCEHPQIRIVHEFADIESTLKNSANLADTHMTIVLQSFSDQYSASAANQLIGQTLFQRLLCCYGPWCESDGRNRSTWPDAVRVPARLAPSVIELELPGVGAEAAPIPPTAARDEIFAHRLVEESTDTVRSLRDQNVAVIGPDRIIRQTVISTVRDLGMRTISLPLITIDPRASIRPQETPRGPIDIVLHDLDPWSDAIHESLEGAQQMFPSARILGLATMPDAGLTAEIVDEHLDDVIPKLDMHHGLLWKLKELLLAPIEYTGNSGVDK